MGINIATTIANQEIGTNKAQAGLDVLTRTLSKSEPSAPSQEGKSDAMRLDVAQQTGKGQNIDIKV